MTNWRAIPLKRAEQYAEQFIQLIQLDCVAVSVAGEVRRKQRVTSNPIEVVAVPLLHPEVNLFGEAQPDLNFLAATIKRLIDAGRCDEVREAGRGKKTPNEFPTKLLFRANSGMLCPVDLWMTTLEKFGAVLALRTGPHGLRSGLMTPQQSLSSSGRAGLLPRDMQVSERTGLIEREAGTVLNTRTESIFWDIIGQKMIAPEDRR